MANSNDVNICRDCGQTFNIEDTDSVNGYCSAECEQNADADAAERAERIARPRCSTCGCDLDDDGNCPETRRDRTTPRPWRVSEDDIDEIGIFAADAGGCRICVMDADNADLRVNRADAKLITHAVNAYDRLRAFVEDLAAPDVGVPFDDIQTEARYILKAIGTK